MVHLHDAIRALYSSIITIRGDIAYDTNEQEVAYDMTQVEAKLAEMQAKEAAKQEAQVIEKQSAMAKLSALGLTADEVKALVGQ